ncbi:hypothetical protein [Acetobacter pasteurianus]|uniref:hypothetical protein n=1 Tax=Acetobacter pasteurianus TaxID=438 RepID=UPI0005525AFD|nr:hypothetical protein [Acetobacter pasteurianus]
MERLGINLRHDAGITEYLHHFSFKRLSTFWTALVLGNVIRNTMRTALQQNVVIYRQGVDETGQKLFQSAAYCASISELKITQSFSK